MNPSLRLPAVAACVLLLSAASCGQKDYAPNPGEADSSATTVSPAMESTTHRPDPESTAEQPDLSSGLEEEPVAAGTDRGLCLEYVWGDARHLDSCTAMTRAECLAEADEEGLASAADSASEPDYVDYGEMVELEFIASEVATCSSLYAASAREAEDMMSSQWGWWVHATGIEVGDAVFTYGANVDVRERPDSASPVVHVVESDATLAIVLEKSERTQINDRGGSWFKVRVGEVEGWIWAEFVHPDPKSDMEYIM